jgi:diguanylate cyclase (GGDEF)-like protein
MFRFSGWLAAILAIGVYAASKIALVGSLPPVAIPVVVVTVVIIGAVFLSWLVAFRTSALTRQINNDQRMIEELQQHDPTTSLVRFQYAQQTLKLEVIRSQRYKLDLSLLLMEVVDWKRLEEERGMVEMDEIRKQLGSILIGATREVDTPFTNGKMGSILPQTNQEGACIVAERLVASTARRLKLDLRVGVACFPGDAVSDDDMIEAAESALKVGLTSGRPIVFYNQIREAIQSPAN